MAGLASASALSSVFDEVILLERDNLPAQVEVRGGPSRSCFRSCLPQHPIGPVDCCSRVNCSLDVAMSCGRLQALPAKRGGVPQFQQPHVMLCGGLRLCEDLFGGFKDNLRKAGAQDVDWLKDCSVVSFTCLTS